MDNSASTQTPTSDDRSVADRLATTLALLARRDAELEQANADLASTHAVMPGALIVVDLDGRITRVNRALCEMLRVPEYVIVDADASSVWPTFSETFTPQVGAARLETHWLAADGTAIPVLVSGKLQTSGGHERVVCVGIDLRERHREEIERRHAQKLEALGQLAAGVAHEINSPMQFINDNLYLMRQGYLSIRVFIDTLLALRQAARDGAISAALLDEIDAADRSCQWSYFAPRLERAFNRAQDGVARVTEIVGALKLFSHPRNELCSVDINRALLTTLTVARPETRPVAVIETDLAELPPVLAHAGDLNQVFLNLIVNAAHAIADAPRDERGRIAIRTRVVGDRVEVAIADTGCGIPAAIRDRVFDPFFTTKAPGRGTGQGLALAHAVVERHCGTIRFDSDPAVGTTFYIELPVAGPHPRGTP